MSRSAKPLRRLDRCKYGVAISWDRARQEIDLDLQVLVVDGGGAILDAIYHNNLVAMSGAIAHSGDTKVGHAHQYGECVWIDIAKLPFRVKMLIFVVAACSGGHLIDVRRGMISLLKVSASEPGDVEVVSTYPMENSFGDVDAVIMMKRCTHDGSWMVEPIDELAEEGESFLDIPDVIDKLIRADIKSAPRTNNGRFCMEKADSGETLEGRVRASMHARNRRMFQLKTQAYVASLTWDKTLATNGAVDFHAVVVNEAGLVTDIVNASNNHGAGGAVCSSADADTCPEEQELCVAADLELLPQDVKLVVFVLTVDQDTGLRDLGSYTVLLLNETSNKSRARFCSDLSDCSGSTTVVMWFARSAAGLWQTVQGGDATHEARHLLEARHLWGGIIREFLPNAPSDAELLRVRLDPGGVFALPRAAECRTVLVDVSWSLPSCDTEFRGLVVAVVLFDTAGSQVSAAVVTRQRELQSSGRAGFVQVGRAGTSVRYSERLDLDLVAMGTTVDQIFVLTTAVGENTSMETVTGLQCSLSTESGEVMAVADSSACTGEDAGIVLVRFKRDEGGMMRPPTSLGGSPTPGGRSILRLAQWRLQCLGVPLAGRVWSDNDCMRVVKGLLTSSLRTLQLRGIDALPLLESDENDTSIFDFGCEEEESIAHVPDSGVPYLLLASAAASADLMRGRYRRREGKKISWTRRSMITLQSLPKWQKSPSKFQTDVVWPCIVTPRPLLTKAATGPLFRRAGTSPQDMPQPP